MDADVLRLSDIKELFDCRIINSNGQAVEAGTLVSSLLDRIANLEHELNIKRAHIKRLKAEGDSQLKASKHYKPAVAILEYWRDLCHPEARELTQGERVRKVVARLAGGYTEEQLKECVEGYSKFPYVTDRKRRSKTGTPAQRYIDAELIFRDAKHVDQGIALAVEADRLDEPMPQLRAPDASVQLSALGQSAVLLANTGFHVFPVAVRAKVPVTPNGLKDATQDIERIVRFWSAHPEHNVAIRCGMESDLVVLDVDGEEGMDSLTELEKQYGSLPKTASVVTPRGGQHYYFRHPGIEIKNTAGYPGLGLDIRGDGGYVLAPPSIGPTSKRYEQDDQSPPAEMPGWLREMLVNRQTAYERIDPSEWENMVNQGVAKGQRNNQLTRLAGYLWHKHEPGIALGILLNTNREKCSPPLPDREVNKIMESIQRREARKLREEARA